MKNISLLSKKLQEGVFVYTAETTPPDASDMNVLINRTIFLKGVADAINVTDSPGAKVHMSALTASIILVQNDIEPILQLTVRDRNRIALQGDLVGASALGIHNILCLSGDNPKNGDQPESVAVNDINSLTLVKTANLMRNAEQYPSGRKIDPPPKFFIGGAEVPTAGLPDPKKILQKIDAGVDFFQTQYVFEDSILKEYMNVLEGEGILEKTHFIIGIGPFASAKSAKWMNDNLFGVSVPNKIIKRLEQSQDQKKESKNICIELIQSFREIRGVKGVHLMGHNKEEVIAEIIKESKMQ
ncbi:MAG: Bifunctional homocysteine S-methyltransferase/5,10-methylenetetrahydrofolate reductase [Alphaproteobacteria bacterium MarineAlpha5_Bin11]|nr:MAG: Bifunctional homocysteine S-methyltransferase/5,10-methylenetetrahydrofolate reductase [Alphaproteobacteria bacterium MarineAlpha5_Bin11]PPR51707.1 MAG: Bifunctional homocysteine S-methyltransferase/5,10-methylenetetrahydrofolate reductase [Alphaproteobacteria bacterium MarineAlpha5_Bin10]|tara:strand:+ start:4573 stop:5469 length:897 start_codon:yes stop_codon:yes gene_type:complete